MKIHGEALISCIFSGEFLYLHSGVAVQQL